MEQRTLTAVTVHRTKWFAGKETKQVKIILLDACGKTMRAQPESSKLDYKRKFDLPSPLSQY